MQCSEIHAEHLPALLPHVHRRLPPASRAGRTQRGRRWADGGHGTPERSGRRSDVMNCTRPSAGPRRLAAAPGGNLTRGEPQMELMRTIEC